METTIFTLLILCLIALVPAFWGKLCKRAKRPREQEDHAIRRFKEIKERTERKRVIEDFAERVQYFPSAHTTIFDISCLPHPKSKILAAFSLEIAEEPDAERKSGLMSLVACLADYQEGVGQEPLHPLGLDIEVLMDVCNASVEAFATLVGCDKMKERQEHYKQISVLVNQENVMYMEMLAKVPGTLTEHKMAYHKLANHLRTSDDNPGKLQELLMFLPEEERAKCQKLLESFKEDKANNKNQD